MQRKEEEKARFYDYRRNSRAQEPTGVFVYPMGLPAIGRFEIFNEVQLNVFRLVAVLIITFLNHWCEPVSKHIRTNGWLLIRGRIINMMTEIRIKKSFKIFL